MSLAAVVLLASVIVFVVAAWLGRSLLAVGLALLALYFLLGVVRV